MKNKQAIITSLMFFTFYPTYLVASEDKEENSDQLFQSSIVASSEVAEPDEIIKTLDFSWSERPEILKKNLSVFHISDQTDQKPTGKEVHEVEEPAETSPTIREILKSSEGLSSEDNSHIRERKEIFKLYSTPANDSTTTSADDEESILASSLIEVKQEPGTDNKISF